MKKKLKILLTDLYYINRLTENRLCVPLNISYVASYVDSLFGESVDIKLFKDFELLLTQILDEKPDIVAFSFYYWNQNLNYYIVNKIREVYGKEVIIVFGGPSIDSIQLEHIKLNKKFPEVDVFVEGEGEAGFANIVERAISNMDTMFDTPIDDTFFVKDKKYQRGENTAAKLDLKKIPSPYLGGYLDEFLDKSYIPLLQATRTCPYQCTFCVSGKDRSRLRAFPLEQVKAEIDYIAKWNKDRPHVILNLAELNFGVNRQDPEIAEYISNVSEKTGYPQSVYFYSDKRFTENSKKVIQALGKINRDGLVFSLQSDHPETLKAIKRKNLSDDNINEGIQWAKEKKIPVTTEVIFGLPYETYESMVELLNKSVEQGFDSIMLHNLFVMEGVELNRDIEQMTHAMQSHYRLLGSNYTMVNGRIIFEYEKVVTSNNYFDFEDFIKIRCLNLMFFSVFQGGFYKFFFQYVKGKGIPLATFFHRFMNPESTEAWPAEYISFVDDFKRNSVNELYKNLDDLQEDVERRYRDNGNDVGEPVRLNPYYFSRLMYSEKGWINEVLQKIFIDMLPVSKELESNFYSEISEILTISERLIINLRDLSLENNQLNTKFDLNGWQEDKFHGSIENFTSNIKNYSLELSKQQQVKLNSFVKENGHLSNRDYYFVAVETIFPRADLSYNIVINE